MTVSEPIQPGQRDLSVFAALLPVFCAAIGWMGAAKPAGLLIAAMICLAAASVTFAIGAFSRMQIARSLLIPLLLVVVYGTARGVAARPPTTALTGAVLGACLAVLVAFTKAGPAIYRFWLHSGEPIGFAISTGVLALAFYGVFTPVGWIVRMITPDPMALKFDRQAGSYWIRHEPISDTDRYFRQF